ncbi:MAG: TetR/AcrR family transcriptional regulator [Microthrixaceae bacterium]
MAPTPESDEHTSGPDDGPGDVQRRAPFSDNPDVGARGQRTRQAILDAALVAFKGSGYHDTSIASIAGHAGCSRVSFYQYFSDKDDLLSHLGTQVAVQVEASTQAMGTVGADRVGRDALRAWVVRHGEIYQRYEPVFRALQAATDGDDGLTEWTRRTRSRNAQRFRSHLEVDSLPPRRLDPLIDLLLATLTTTEDFASSLGEVVPGPYGSDQMAEVLTDVFHRALFGLVPGVNTAAANPPAPPCLPLAPAIAALTNSGARRSPTPMGQDTYDALLDAGERLLVARGYHAARVDDIVEDAGLSHGAFYRYFEHKEQLANVVAFRAMQGVSQAFTEIPAAGLDRAPRGPDADDEQAELQAMRAWLRRYNEAYTAATAMIQVWIDANRRHPQLSGESAAILDWARQRMCGFLGDRGFGDPEREALVLVALLSTFGRHERDSAMVDTAARFVQRGFLGR